MDQLIPSSSAYNLPLAFRLRGRLDLDALHESFGQLVARQDALRTRFLEQDGAPFAVVERDVPDLLRTVDVSNSNHSQCDVVARTLIEETFGQPFQLSSAPLMRALVVKTRAEDHLLGMVMHHIISDMWSLGVLMRELAELYSATQSRSAPQLQPLPISYRDWAERQRYLFDHGRFNDEVTFWQRELDGVTDLLDLSIAEELRYSGQDGSAVDFDVPEWVTARLRSIAQSNKSTLFIVLLAVFALILAEYSGRKDLVIGLPVAGRDSLETEYLIGLFVNTLPARFTMTAPASFLEIVAQVRERALGALGHPHPALSKLVEVLRPARTDGRNPLVQVTFQLQNVKMQAFTLPGLVTERVDLPVRSSKFDLTVHMQYDESTKALKGKVEYALGMFSPRSVERVISDFLRLAQDVATSPRRELTIGAAQSEEAPRAWDDLGSSSVEPSPSSETSSLSPTELVVVETLAEVLERDSVCITDNFFDLGGHSLLAAKFVARLRRELGIPIPLRMVFEADTLGVLAARLERLGQGTPPQSTDSASSTQPE